MSVWQSSLLSSLFFCFSCLSPSAWAAESAHQINTERGIVFRLETAEQVTDNGNTWKCVNCGCKKKAIPMQISAGASLKSNLILEFNNSSKLFSRGKKTWILLKRSVFKPRHSSPTRDAKILIMKPILGPPNVIIIKPPQEEVRRGDIGGDMETWWIFMDSSVWVIQLRFE